MRIRYVYIILALLLSSCHGKRLTTKSFVAVDSFSELNGRYMDESRIFNHIFNIENEVETGIIDLCFKPKDSLIVSYVDTTGNKSIRLKGKKKQNFFEIYFVNKRIYLPPVFMMNQIDRLRIGKGQDEQLLIYKWDESYGMLLPLGAGGSTDNERQYSFSRYDKSAKLASYLVQVDKKWGYANQEDSIIIAPTYDYALPFKNGVAKVARNGRWGFIDTQNNEVIPIIYDIIMRPEAGVIRVCKDRKWGLIDTLNHEISPLKYDGISAFGSRGYQDSLFIDLAKVQIADKIGFINRQGMEVIPAEYDKIDFYSYYNYKPGIYRTRLGNKYGYVSGKGVLCKPIFEKADKVMGYNGFSPKNKTLVDEIGRYTEVIYKGEPYLFTEKGMLYKYKKLGFFKENRLIVDYESRKKVEVEIEKPVYE